MTTKGYFIRGLLLVSLGRTLAGAALASSPITTDVPCPTGTEPGLSTLASEFGVFTALGDHDTTLTSADGVLWSVGSCASFRELHTVAQGAGIMVKAGPAASLSTSTDGVRWICRPSGLPNHLHGIAYGNGRFVAVGNEGALVTSRDGMKWRRRKPHTEERLRGVTYGNGRFVVVGYEGTVLTSRTGRRWVRRQSGTDQRLLGVAFGHGLFVAVGWHGVVLTSSEGVTWTQRQSGTTCNLCAIAYRAQASPTRAVRAGGSLSLSTGPADLAQAHRSTTKDQMEERLDHVFGVFRALATPAQIYIKRVPISPAQLFQGARRQGRGIWVAAASTTLQ
jgi:hypothetical protein